MQIYTIKEASKLSWLPESTLRYYETMWLIDFIKRDSWSWHRTYTEDNVNIISSIACLNRTWMSIWDMKSYLEHVNNWDKSHTKQLEILREQDKRLAKEEKSLALRRKYIKWKIKYWEAISAWDNDWLQEIRKDLKEISEKLRFIDKK
jgi:DNA-binding transcriptional MerR regulator